MRGKMFVKRSASFVRRFSTAELLREHFGKVMRGEIADDVNKVDADGVVFVSTKGFSRDVVDEVRLELHASHFVMNCHTFKSMRLQPLKAAESTETRRLFPLPFDGLKKDHG